MQYEYPNPDPNVDHLLTLSRPEEWGTMLRLAATMELVTTHQVQEHGTLWAYLRSLGFDPKFVEEVARPYWRRACEVVQKTPYYIEVVDHDRAPRRLMAYFLGEVCQVVAKRSMDSPPGQGVASPP